MGDHFQVICIWSRTSACKEMLRVWLLFCIICRVCGVPASYFIPRRKISVNRGRNVCWVPLIPLKIENILLYFFILLFRSTLARGKNKINWNGIQYRFHQEAVERPGEPRSALKCASTSYFLSVFQALSFPSFPDPALVLLRTHQNNTNNALINATVRTEAPFLEP